jgi:hypothetical protein
VLTDSYAVGIQIVAAARAAVTRKRAAERQLLLRSVCMGRIHNPTSRAIPWPTQ